jgi:hypothetical protein
MEIGYRTRIKIVYNYQPLFGTIRRPAQTLVVIGVLRKSGIHFDRSQFNKITSLDATLLPDKNNSFVCQRDIRQGIFPDTNEECQCPVRLE